ncbi:MAG TPA: hypothetical protein VNT33_13850, partial [Telluria sp.]|nr:hypothetical protein [Telluria sp.]
RAQLARATQAGAQQDEDDGDEDEEDPPDDRRQPRERAPGARQADYLSSHPSDAERVARLRAADAKP